MKIFAEYCEEQDYYLIAIKGNKRKSRNFYYKHIIDSVEFILDKERAYKVYGSQNLEFLVNYLKMRIEQVGMSLRKF
jgi:hypothetical protein